MKYLSPKKIENKLVYAILHNGGKLSLTIYHINITTNNTIIPFHITAPYYYNVYNMFSPSLPAWFSVTVVCNTTKPDMYSVSYNLSTK